MDTPNERQLKDIDAVWLLPNSLSSSHFNCQILVIFYYGTIFSNEKTTVFLPWIVMMGFVKNK